MAEELTNRIREVEFHYPKKPWLFALACYLVMLGFFMAFSFGKVPRQFQSAYFGAIAAYLFFVSFSVWDWPAWLAGARKPIILGQGEIKVGKKFASWDEIEEIRHGVWPERAGGIRIKLKKLKRPFFLYIAGYPFVYRELIPAILAIRPDLPVSRIVERAMADPEGSIAPRRWLLAPVLTINVGLLTTLLMPRFQSLFAYFILSFVLLLAGLHLGSWAFRLIITDRDKFLVFALHCSILVIFITLLRAFSQIEPIAAITLIMAVITASVLAFITLFAAKELTGGLQIAILCVLVGVPMGIYAYHRSQQWPARDITTLLCGDEVKVAVWGNSGGRLAGAWYDGNGCVIDANSLERRSVPPHDGKMLTVWLDERFLIRQVKPSDESKDGLIPELWVYDFAKQQDFQVPTSQIFSVGKRNPVDCSGRRLAWIDYEQQGQKLRFWNMETMQEDMKSRELPKDVNWVGGQAVWIGDKEIAICVERADDGRKDEYKRLFVLRMNLENEQQSLFKSSRKYEMWYPVGDFRYAFGINRLEDERYAVDFVDLEKDESKPVAGRDFPLEAMETKCAFHVVEKTVGAYLMRFKYERGEDEQLFRVPKGMNIQGVSPTGQYIMIGLSRFLSFPFYMVVDVKNGSRHRTYLPGFSSSMTPEFTASVPGVSPFSSDERYFILRTFWTGGYQTFLYEIPEKW